MNMLYQKYREHEEQAERCAESKDFPRTAIHLQKAAAFAIELAKITLPPLSDQYLCDANEKMDLAENLLSRSPRTIANSDAPPSAGDAKKDAALSFVLKEKPDVSLKDVVGMEELKKRLDEIIIKPYQYPEKYKKAGLDKGDGGVLLYGPPGTGKTFIAKALAGELNLPFFDVDPSRLVDKYIGETGKFIAVMFEEIRRHPRAIVYLDEVTQLLGDNETTEKTGAAEQFFRETNGLAKSSDGFLLLMATNYPWKLPKPMLRQGRTRDIIYVGLPDEHARLALLGTYAKGRQIGADVDLPEYARRLHGFSSAEVAALMRRAKERSLLREIQSGRDNEVVTCADLEGAMQSIRPASSQKDIDRYLSWGAENAMQ